MWIYQFTLYRRIMWPLKMSEIPSSTTTKMDGKANSFIRKWLGLPRCFSDTGLFGKNTLQLPLQSISLGYKQEKTRLLLELRESTDQSVRNAGVKVRTGRCGMPKLKSTEQLAGCNTKKSWAGSRQEGQD